MGWSGRWCNRSPGAIPRRRKNWSWAAALLRLPDQKLGGAVETVTRALAQKSLPEAETWVAKLPAAQAEPATEALFREWASRDSAAASERLDTLPPGKLRDRSIVGFSWSASPYDPESAGVWASSIEDAALRKRALRNLAYNWREKDRSAARTFASGIFDPAMRKEVLEIVNQRD